MASTTESVGGGGGEAGHPQGGAFVRRSSGLVRDVSPIKAMFFSMAAAFGGGIAFTFQNMTVTGQPLWTFGFTAYAWAAIAVGAACVLLGVLYAVLASAMPRAGANYVFTSRLISPLLAWVESWSLVVGIVAVCAVLIPLGLLMITLFGTVMGLAYPDSSMWDGATGWFTTKDSQFIGGTIAIILACLFAILPTRAFFRSLTVLGLIAVGTMFLMVIVTPFLSHDTFVNNVVELTGQTPDQIIEAAAFPTGGGTFLGFMALCSFILFAYVGFQYAAFISGEMSGSVKRGTYIAILGALGIAVFLSSVYNDVLARKFGLELTAAWSYLFWTGGDLPGGVMSSPPTLGAIASPDLWPLWGLCALIAALFTFLLVPVWFVVAARIVFAWAMDRQAPEWLSRVNPRTNAPLNAILLTAIATEVILYLSAYQGLNLGSTLWLATLLFSFAWILPGVNALIARRRRPDLFGDAPKHLELIGVLWLVAILMIYVFAIFKPLYEGLTSGDESAGSYLNSSGVLAALIVVAIGLVLYFVNVAWNRSRGVERTQVFATIPPD